MANGTNVSVLKHDSDLVAEGASKKSSRDSSMTSLYWGIGLIVIATISAIFTNLWFLTALPVGVLFGFFLQKGDLCGASAFSEVVISKDWRKIWGLWVCIVVSMAGFAVLDISGLVTLNVKPMFWMNYVVGGVLFGVGMVLAGGCVSGCLFKAATGNINSIVALIAIPVGISLVEYGPLHAVFISMKNSIINTADGRPLALHTVTTIPYWAWALVFGVITIFFAFNLRTKTARAEGNGDSRPASIGSALRKPWKPWHAGVAIGILMSLAYLSSAASGRNYPLGTTHGVLFAQNVITDSPLKHIYQKPVPKTVKPAIASDGDRAAQPAAAVTPQPRKKVVWWLVLLCMGIMIGSFVSAKLSRTIQFLPRPPEQTITAVFGGLLVGAGAAIAMGCVVGNIMSGWALLSIGTVLFGVVTVLSNWITTYFYHLGGMPFSK